MGDTDGRGNKIPVERLNQIAQRKLNALNIPAKLSEDKQRLEGELTFPGEVKHPTTQAPIPKSRFVVVEHDQLQFTDPPLSGLSPVQFYDASQVFEVEERVRLALQRRLALLQDLGSKLKKRGLAVALVADRLLVQAMVQTTGHKFELLGGPDGVRVSRVAPLHGKPFEVSPDFPALKFEELSSAVDFEVALEHAVSAMKPAAAAPPVRPPEPKGAPVAKVQVAPPSANALSLAALVAKFQDATVTSSKLELTQEVEVGGTRFRFVATHESGNAFRGRILGPSGEKWNEKFDLERFPGIVPLVQAVGGGAPSPKPQAPPQPPAAAPVPASLPASVPSHLIPVPGEVWIMNVLVEQDDGKEVRYVCMDIEGNPYGASRILKRVDFEAVFTQAGGGWRLLIVIEAIEGETIQYHQLDSQRQPRGPVKSIPAAILVSTFVPEATAY